MRKDNLLICAGSCGRNESCHDLEDTTLDGPHIVSLAGAWLALVAGFRGMRDHEGGGSNVEHEPQINNVTHDSCPYCG